jgi:hypothetical protein
LAAIVVENTEDDGNVEDNEDDEEEFCEDETDQIPVDEKDCCTQVLPETLEPFVFNEEAAYSTVDDSDTHPEGIQIIHKRKNRTPRLKRKQRLSDERTRAATETKAVEQEKAEVSGDNDAVSETEVTNDVPSPRHQLITHRQSTQTEDMREDAGTQTDDDELSSANATINSTHSALNTEDLSDLALSNSGDDKVTFKEEVASASPKHSGHSEYTDLNCT